MTLPIPVHVAASGFEMLVWLIVAAIWLIFQGLANSAKKKLPSPEDEEHPTLRPLPQHPENTPRDELRELIETITGQKPPMSDPGDEEEEPPTLPRPASRPAPIRNVVRTPSRFSQPARKMERPAQSSSPMQRAATRMATPPPAPQPAAVPAPTGGTHPVFAQAAMPSEALRLAPLLKMTWPRSQFQRLAGAARRVSPASRLKHQLNGQAALRQAMISRIVLGPPGGR
ncbi:MAG: hypothetical protein NTY53_06420 [Kiritimatiellaeota bacterium]|nr:hypothetical protein [Kiritimatiellota bacterium]